MENALLPSKHTNNFYLQVGLFNQISLEQCPGLANLLNSGEKIEDMMKLSPGEASFQIYNIWFPTTVPGLKELFEGSPINQIDKLALRLKFRILSPCERSE